MKAIRLNFADILIKLLYVIYGITLCIGIGAFIVWALNGSAIQIKDSIVIDRSLIQSALSFENILAFSIPLIIEAIIMLYILTKTLKLLKKFKGGLVFDAISVKQIKSLADWVVILVITKIFLDFFSNAIIKGEFELNFSADFLILLLFMTLAYIVADIVKKGADLKSENDLTI